MGGTMLRPALALAALALGFTGLAAAPAVAAPAAGPPVFLVQPHQYFSGLVNGRSGESTIEVICVGPSATGHPRAGQTIGVSLVTVTPGPVTSYGYTGEAANSIVANRPDSASTTPIAVFTVY